MEVGLRRLGERHVDFRFRRAVETLLMHVGGDPHDLEFGGFARRATGAMLGAIEWNRLPNAPPGPNWRAKARLTIATPGELSLSSK